MKEKINIYMLYGMKEIETDIYNELPQGWKITKGTLTQPNGYVWINNGKTFFEKDENGNRTRKIALMSL